MQPLKLCGVTVSLGYADYLWHFLANNCRAFEYLAVVTAPEDRSTQKVCEWWNVDCVITDVMTKDGGFNKGKGINEGLKRLKEKNNDISWILHADSDIITPPHFKNFLCRLHENGTLKNDCIYSCDRVMVTSYEDWVRFMVAPDVQAAADVFILPPKFELGVRLAKFKDSDPTIDFGGWLPLGFFQLWNAQGCGLPIDSYSEKHTSAGRSDLVFAAQWPREKRALLPEMFVYHLANESAQNMGINWNGRKSDLFLPSPTVVNHTNVVEISDDLVIDLASLPKFVPDPGYHK